MSETWLKILSVAIPHLTITFVLVGLVLRALWRFERRTDALLAKYDEWDAKSQQQFDATRDEIVTSMRVKTDRAIAAMHQGQSHSQDSTDQAEGLKFIDFARSALACVVPHHDEIRLVPRWGIVAFAARCARRVMPLFSTPMPRSDQSTDPRATVAHAVEYAEASAATGGFTYHMFLPQDPGVFNALVGSDADTTAFVRQYGFPTWATGRASIASALGVARATIVEEAPQLASNAARNYGDISASIRRDFETVHSLVLTNGWNDNTPVPPSVFGPLWPDGPPKGWPMPDRPATEVTVEFDIPADMGTDEAVALAKLLGAELCRLHLAGGGHGLAIRPPLEITRLALVPAPTA